MIGMLAVAKNTRGEIVIGQDNDLLFKSKSDLKHFSTITQGATLVMGRKTVESLPFKLKNRQVICITDQMDYSNVKCDMISPLDVELIHKYSNKLWGEGGHPIFICGGSSIYESLLPICTTIFLTKFEEVVEYNINQTTIQFGSWFSDFIPHSVDAFDEVCVHNPTGEERKMLVSIEQFVRLI